MAFLDFACSNSSRTSAPAPSDNTKPSRSWSQGREASSGLSLVERALDETKQDDCDGNYNYQKFIPIVYSYSSFPIGSQVGVINTIGSDDLVINDDLQGEGFFGTSNFSTSPNTFCFCTSGGSFEAFPGAGSSNYSGTNKASGTYELEEDNGILKLIYYKASKCVQPVTNGLAHHKFFDADSVECIDSNYTWYPSHCAKITFIKQNN